MNGEKFTVITNNDFIFILLAVDDTLYNSFRLLGKTNISILSTAVE